MEHEVDEVVGPKGKHNRPHSRQTRMPCSSEGLRAASSSRTSSCSRTTGQEQLITLDEFRARMPELRRREATLRAELDALDAQLHDAEAYLKLTETLDAFRARLSANAKQLSIEQRQEIVRLVVREVLLGDDDITVRHSIPLPNGRQPGGSLLRSQSHSAAQGDQGRVRRARAGSPLPPPQGMS